MKVMRCSVEMARHQYRTKRSINHAIRRNYVTINGYRIYSEKHCIMVTLPADHKQAFGLHEGKFFGTETLILTECAELNPALMGRE